jgi:hypothetical protein
MGAQFQRFEGFGDLVGVIDGQIQAPLSAVLLGEALDRLANSGGVDHRHQLGQMLGQHLEIQDLVVGAELIEKNVAGQIRWHALQLSSNPCGLLLQGQHARGEPASQTQLPSLLVRKPDSTVDTWRSERRWDLWCAACHVQCLSVRGSELR